MRGLSGAVDIAGSMKDILVANLKESAAFYKTNYLALSKAKAMKDLLVFRSKNLNNQIENYMSSIQAKDPNAYSYLNVFRVNFGYQRSGFWAAPQILDMSNLENAKLRIAAIKSSNTVEEMRVKISDTGLAVGFDEKYAALMPYKNDLADYMFAAVNLQDELNKANLEIETRQSQIGQYENALNNALNEAQKYIPGLPTISQIQARLDKDENPLPELDPPPAPKVEPAMLSPVAIQEAPETPKKSIVPIVAGAAAIAFALFGKK